MQKNLLECRAQLWIPQSGSETAALMEEYGRHFKMKNGNRAQCHLINVKPWWREGTTACGGGAVPGHMSPEEGGRLNGPTFTALLISVAEMMMVLAPSGDVAKEVVSSWEVLNNTIHLVTQYYRHHLPKEPSSPVACELPSFMQNKIHLGEKKKKSPRRHCGCA